MRTAPLARAVLHDFFRAVTSRPVLAIIVLMVAASALFLGVVAQGSSSAYSVRESSIYYFSGGGLHFQFFAFDTYANPVAGQAVMVDLGKFVNGTHGSRYVPLANLTGTTNSSGMWAGVADVPDGNYTVQVSSGSVANAVLSLSWLPPGEVQPLLGVVAQVELGSEFDPHPALSVFFMGGNGTLPLGYHVYYALTSNQSALGSPLPEPEMTFLGTMSSAASAYPLEISSSASQPNGTFGPSPQLVVEIFSPGGHLEAWVPGEVGVASFVPRAAGSAGPSDAFDFVVGLLGFFFPLMALIAAYTTYGRDRLSGALDAVLAQPIDRRSLALVRCLAVATAMAIAALIVVASIDAMVWDLLGSPLGLAVSSSLVLGLVVESSCFTGLSFLIAHLVRTPTALLGTSIAGVIGLTLGWVLLPSILAASFNIPLGSPSFAVFETHFEFLSPGAYLSLVQVLETNPGLAEVAGVSFLSLTLVALLWIVLPILALARRASTRD